MTVETHGQVPHVPVARWHSQDEVLRRAAGAQGCQELSDTPRAQSRGTDSRHGHGPASVCGNLKSPMEMTELLT